MFRILLGRKAERSSAETTAAEMIGSFGGPAAEAMIRRRLRWLDPADTDGERDLVLVLQAIEKRLRHRRLPKVGARWFLDEMRRS